MVQDIQSQAFESGREMMNWADFEEQWLNDINEATYKYKAKYGNKDVLTMLSIDNNACNVENDALLDCFAQSDAEAMKAASSNIHSNYVDPETHAKKIAFYDPRFAKLHCRTLIDAYTSCVQRQLQSQVVSHNL